MKNTFKFVNTHRLIYALHVCTKKNAFKHTCNMISFFSFDLFMIYIPECRRQIRTMK